MERLNDIMMRTRTVQRRQQAQSQQDQQDQQAQQGPPPSEQWPRQPMRRRSSLPEQPAHQGHSQSQPAQPTQPTQLPQPSNRQITGGTTHRGNPTTRYPQSHSPYGPAQRKSVSQRRPPTYYQQPPSQELPSPPNTQRRPRMVGDYKGRPYDAYEAIPPADVQEEWEEDAPAMRYGDWEGDESTENVESNEEISFYAPPTVESRYTPPPATTWSSTRAARSLPASPLTTRELSTMPSRELESRSPLTQRDPRLPQSTYASQGAPPAPLAPPQEAQRHQRITQPLDPRAIAGMDRRLPQEVPQPTPVTTRQVTVRNQTTQPAPLPTKGPCPQCKGAGYLRAEVPYGDPHFGKPIACACKELERADKRRLHLSTISNLGAFSDKSFENFQPYVPGIQDAFKVSRAYANDPDGWLLLVGRNGCGKTHLAAAIANQRLTKGSLVLFATVPDLLDHLRATFAPTSTVVYDQLFSSMREAELLILDDLGSEQNSPWASEKLFQLLNYRYNSRFPTVITTNNLRLQAVDERIRSRLTDKSLVIEVMMDRVQDYRPHNPRRG